MADIANQTQSASPEKNKPRGEPVSPKMAAVLLFLAGPATIGITSLPDNPSIGGLVLGTLAWFGAFCALTKGYGSAKGIALALLCIGGGVCLFLELPRLLSIIADGWRQIVAIGVPLMLMIHGGATAILCAFALRALRRRKQQ